MTERRNIFSLSSPPMLLKLMFLFLLLFRNLKSWWIAAIFPIHKNWNVTKKMAVLLHNILDIFQQALMGLFSWYWLQYDAVDSQQICDINIPIPSWGFSSHENSKIPFSPSIFIYQLHHIPFQIKANLNLNGPDGNSNGGRKHAICHGMGDCIDFLQKSVEWRMRRSRTRLMDLN